MARYRGAVTDAPAPTAPRPGVPFGEATSVRDIDVAGRPVRVIGVGLACCALEVVEGIAALDPRGPLEGSPQAHVVVVGGTVSLGIKAQLDRVWAETPEPKTVVAFGACTISGGPYWDSYTVLPGLRGEYGPAVEVPGCPPRPDVLRGAVEAAAQQLMATHNETAESVGTEPA